MAATCSTVAAQQGTSAADWTTPRCGPAFMQKDTSLRWWLAVGAAGAELGRASCATVDCLVTVVGDGENDEGGDDSSAFGEGSPVENAVRWPAAVVSAAALSDACRAAAGSARLLGKPARACTHCQRAAMPTISASLSAASIEGHVCMPPAAGAANPIESAVVADPMVGVVGNTISTESTLQLIVTGTLPRARLKVWTVLHLRVQ